MFFIVAFAANATENGGHLQGQPRQHSRKATTMRARLLPLCAVALLAAGAAHPQEKGDKKATTDADRFGATDVRVYKTAGDEKLRMRIYLPEGHKPTDRRPAIVFFFGGGWRSGSPKQFTNQAKYLASRGMVAVTAEYRVYTRHKATVADCVRDAASAVRWVRANAGTLGIDPDRIAAAGGSAGGHLAAAVGTLSGFDDLREDAKVSARPKALVLFNPALDLRAEAFGDRKPKKGRELDGRLGAKVEALSPTLHVTRGTPPAVIFHGKADTTVPYQQAERFCAAMKKAGNRCELVGYDGQPHGFFNFGRSENRYFVETMRRTDEFLASLGYLKGEPTIDRFAESLAK
jgi:acetyl esterase/lipase